MRRLLLPLLLLFASIAFPNLASAQSFVTVVASCSGLSLTPGSHSVQYMDVTGNLCTSSAGGSGGGTSSAFGAAFPASGTAAGFEYLSVPPTLTTGQMVAGQTDVNGNLKENVAVCAVCNANGQTTSANSSPVVIASDQSAVSVAFAPSSSSTIGITPIVSASAENNHVLKASAGNTYSVYATNLTSTAGFLVLLNATSSPSDGAITPLACASLPGNGVASINYSPGPPGVFSTGIVAVVSSANTCFTKTTGTITAFISGLVK